MTDYRDYLTDYRDYLTVCLSPGVDDVDIWKYPSPSNDQC